MNSGELTNEYGILRWLFREHGVVIEVASLDDWPAILLDADELERFIASLQSMMTRLKEGNQRYGQ
jgi:hypothetical protein